MLNLGRYQSLFANRAYRYLWFGQAVSGLGDGMARIAMMLLVHRLTGGSASAVSMLMVLLFLPQILFSPIAGALADRWNGRRVMQLVDATRAVVTCLIPFAPSISCIYLIATAESVLSTLFFSARSRVLRCMVEPEQFVTMGSLSQVTSGVIGMVAPALGGLAMAWFGPAPVFLIDALTFMASVVAITLVGHANEFSANPIAGNPVWPSLISDLQQGLRVLIHNPVLLQCTGIFGAASLTNGVVSVLLATYTHSALPNGATTLGSLYSLNAVAAMATSTALGARASAFRERMVTVGGLAFAASAALLALSPNLVWMSLLMIGAGVGSTIISVVAPAILLRDSPEPSLGKVMGLFNSAVNVAGLAGYLIAAPLDTKAGPALGMAAATLPVWVVVFIAALNKGRGKVNGRQVRYHQIAD
jgi:MFS family permease